MFRPKNSRLFKITSFFSDQNNVDCVRLTDTIYFMDDEEEPEEEDETMTTGDSQTPEEAGPRRKRNFLCDGHLVTCLFACFHENGEHFSSHTCNAKPTSTGQFPPSGGMSAKHLSIEEVAFAAIKLGRMNAYTYYRLGF